MSAPPSLPPGSASRLDAQHPWPGLGSYDEQGSEFFSGRHAEALDLAQMIRLWGAVVLSGESGLGKTSLLRAGVFPRLWELNFFPVYIRLLHAPDAPPYGMQVIDRVLEECRNRPDMDPPVLPEPGESLWQWLHRADVEFWNSRNQLMTPVLVFDQFEEIFTRGAESRRRSETDAFFTELADIAENRRPDEIPRGCTEAQNYRVVLSLRKEYLSELEICLGPRMPSALQNRFHLAPLTLEAALEVVRRPAEPGNLLERGAEMAIVAAVSGLRINRQIGGTLSAPEIEGNSRIEPALLCLLCSELNSERLRLGQDRISTSLVEARGGDIIEGFYERALADFPVEVQRMVESLVTPNGQRLSRAEEEVLAMPGISAEVIRELTENDRKRLLRRDRGLGGIPTLELVHDCLAPIVARHREERHRQDLGRERRIKQLKTLTRVLAVIAVVGVLSGILIAAKIQADAKARIERSLKEHLNLSSMVLDNIAAEKNSSMDPKGAAYAARALESNPQFLPAIERARALILRSSPSPDLIYSSPNLIYGPSMIGDNLILIDSTGELQIIDSTGTQIRTRKLDGRIEMGNASRGGQAIAWLSTTELDQRSKGEDPSTDGEANSDEENSAQASAGDSSDSMNAERSPDAVKKKDLEANQRRATQEEEEPKFRLHRLDLQTGQLTASAIIDSRVSSICVSSDGSKVLLVTLEGILKVWNGKSNESARTVFNTKEIRPKLLQASAKGGWLAIGHSEEGHPVLITVAAEEAATHTTLAYAEPIVDFLESSCGTRIMARDEEGEVMVFNTRGLLLRKVNAKGSVRIMGIDSLGLTYITVNDDNLAEFWNVLDGEPCRPARVLSQASRPVNILDQGRYLIAAESDGSIYRYQSGWNPGSADSREIARFGAESNDLFLLPSSPVGKVLAIATDDHRIHFLDPETGDPRREAVKLGGEPIPLIPLPGNDRLLAGGGSSVWLVPVSPDQEPQEFKLQPDSALSHSVVDLVVSPDTQAFHVLTNTGVLETHRLDDPKAAAKSREFPDESGKRLIISPAGVEPWLAMTTHLPTQRQWLLRVFRMEDDVPGKVFVEWTSNSEIWTMVSDPGGRWLAALTWDGTISVFDLASDDPANEGRRTLNLGSSAYNAAFLVGGDRPVLVTGDSQGQLSRWDVIDAKARRDEFVNPCPETVTSLTLSPSGKWLACTTFSGRAVIWDTSTGFAKMLPITHAARIWSFAFDESTNPVRVYTSSRDGHIKVTDLDLGIVQNENDVINMARILQWQSGQIIDRAGGASALGPHEREALLNEAAKDGVSDLYKWATTPPWERGQRPGEQPNAPAEPSLDWEDRRFPSPWRHAYDRDPEDPLAALALAAWIQNFDHAKWLAEQAIPRLADDEITTTRAIQYLNDAGLSSDAVKLIAKWTPEKTALASALEAARACSLSDDRDQAIKWLKPHFDSLSKDRRELARLVIECFRAGADAEGLRVFVRFKEAYPSTAGNTTEAWATLAAGLVGHAQGDKASLERVREASQWFEQNSGTYGWKREGHFGWAIASQFLRDQGQETTLAPVDIYRFALGENDLPFAYAAYEKIDPFSKLLDALAKAENTPELDSADLYLGRILHQWFSGDVEGARVSWKMLLEFDDRFDDPEFRAGLQLWPYELQAIEKIVAGKDNWMEEVEIPDDTQEWGAVGIPDPEVLADLTDDTSEYTLAGRILHLSMLGDHLNAVATARLLLMRNPAWAETAHLESEGWDPEEIALFLSAIDQAQSTPSSP